MHICSPYFGPDPAGIGPQHGYARDVEWTIDTHNTGGNVVRLFFMQEEGERAGLNHTLSYALRVVPGDNSFGILSCLLSLHNSTGSQMQVAPGLHPYFKGPDPKGVADKSPRVYGDTQDAPQMTKTESGVGIGIVSIDMPQRVIWSDMPDEYHCLEPISIPEALEPGQTRTFSTELFILPQNGAN